jgi:serpin B
MMKKYLFTISTVVIVGMMLSCSQSDMVNDFGKSTRIVNMLSTPRYIQLTNDQKTFVSDNNGFTLKFLKSANQASPSGRSYIYSPLSITYVLGMVNAAATGQTELELEQALGFHKGGIQAVNEYCKNLIDNLPKVDDQVTLNIANAIFLNKTYTLKEQFQKDMEHYYDAKAEALDFNSPSTLSHINDWCNDKTNGMIPTILDEVNPKMVSYLLNAIYFKADWTSKFDPNNTKTETFTTEKGITQQPMMHQAALIAYTHNDTFSAVRLPYSNGMWNMTVLLPEEGKSTEDVIDEMTGHGSFLTTHLNVSMNPYEVDLKLPRFDVTSDTDQMNGRLIGLLQQLGIKLAFEPTCIEICNMCTLPIYIAMMRQKASIKVNEEGSEAAVVTVAEGMATSAISKEYQKATFHANRPFVYVISEASSDVILFVGKYTGE